MTTPPALTDKNGNFIYCIATTKKGSQCKLFANFPDIMCHVHSPLGIYQQQHKNGQRKKKPRKEKKEDIKSIVEIAVKTALANQKDVFHSEDMRIRKNYAKEWKHLSRKKRYKKYLKTNHWRTVSLKARTDTDWRCQICGKSYKNKKKSLHVHHNNYKNLWEERKNDLLVVCKPCHNRHHVAKP